MRSTERQFFAFEMVVNSSKAGATMPTMRRLAELWQQRARDKTAKILTRKQKVGIVIGDCEIDNANNCAILLIRLSDKEAPDAAYSDLENDTYTEHAKTPTQGGDLAAHVLVSLKHEKNFADTYLCLIEKIPNLRQDAIRQILNATIKKTYDADNAAFAYPHPAGARNREGQIRQETCLPRIDFEGRPSSNFTRDVNSGRLNELTLIKTEPGNPVGGVSYLKKKESTLRIGVDRGNLPQNVWDDILKVTKRNARDYPEASLSFKLPGAKRSVSVRFSSNNGHPLDDTYIMSVELKNIYPLLAASSRTIVAHLIDMAKPHLLRLRNV